MCELVSESPKFPASRDRTNQSLRAPCGRAGSVERTRVSGCTRRGSGVGLWRFLPPRVAVEAGGGSGRRGGGEGWGGGGSLLPLSLLGVAPSRGGFLWFFGRWLVV